MFDFSRISISSDEFALCPKFVYDKKERILNESHVSYNQRRGEMKNEKVDVITGKFSCFNSL